MAGRSNSVGHDPGGGEQCVSGNEVRAAGFSSPCTPSVIDGYWIFFESTCAYTLPYWHAANSKIIIFPAGLEGAPVERCGCGASLVALLASVKAGLTLPHRARAYRACSVHKVVELHLIIATLEGVYLKNKPKDSPSVSPSRSLTSPACHLL